MKANVFPTFRTPEERDSYMRRASDRDHDVIPVNNAKDEMFTVKFRPYGKKHRLGEVIEPCSGCRPLREVWEYANMVCVRYKQGDSIVSLSRTFSCSKRSIRTVLAEYRVPIYKRGRRKGWSLHDNT